MHWLALVFLSVAVLLGLGACSRTQEMGRQEPTAKPVSVAPVLDVPQLLGLSIDELVPRLGPFRSAPSQLADPAVASLVSLGEAPDSLAFFESRGLELLATYDPRSRRVLDLVLLGHNEDVLMQRAQLQPSTRSYVVLPVYQASHAGQLLGVRVVATGL